MVVFDGLILTILEDFGPAPIVNLSKMDEATATHLSITGLTIVGLGSTRVYLRLFGSIPVPDFPDSEAMPFIFSVSGEDSADERIIQQGRDCVIFLLFASSNRASVYATHHEVEKILNEHVKNFQTREDLSQAAMEVILGQINQIEPPSIQELPLEEQEIAMERKAGLDFYQVLPDGELQETSLSDGLKSPILIIVNHVNQLILKLTLSEDISERYDYLAARAANRVNVERLRNAYRIRDIDDPLEIDMLLEKIRTGFKIS
ncbi:MAG: hypothetical protein ACE5R6_01815 [Candidatus Heimdallarchaeota archaeon]